MTTPASDYPDLDHPGYLRQCFYPGCGAKFHVLRGGEGRWRMGRGGPLGGQYICPAHVPVALGHQPSWADTESPVIAVLCKCGWKWSPGEVSPAGAYLDAWTGHLPVRQGPAPSPELHPGPLGFAP